MNTVSSTAAPLPHAAPRNAASTASHVASSAAPNAPRRWQGLATQLGTRAVNIAAGLILPLLLLGLWQYAVDQHWLAEQILPAPALVWQSLVELWDNGDLTANLAISLSRLGWSLAIGGGAGFLLGIAMGISPTIKAYVYPGFQLVSQFPVIGWVPLLIIFAGIGEALKIAAISIAVVVPVAVNTFKGIRNIPRALLEVAAVYRFTFWQKVRRLVLPAAAGGIFNGLRQGVMQAWLSLVFVELLASSEGIGYLMVWGRQLLQLDIVVVGMIVIGAVGIVLDRLLAWGEARLQGWQRRAY
ncbi:ABC transporter permease [Pseudoduganella lutea]|uniref:ABC transporter permease n=1 Tax=Pseudoduganella lutea TaxID=321985 RepID=A0A4P6KXM4_9BURK|nr:ABC transporter permease [Pseudoduganella lutea]